jgi:large subunit ribosomal protein L22
MGQEKNEPRFSDKQAGATAKFVRVPPRKARLVLDAVRGKYVSDALALLKFVPNHAARAIEKVLKSAVANAENSRPHDENGRPSEPLIEENLRLVRAWADEGPRIKRVQPRAQGRAYRIVKRMCHLSVIVEEVDPKPRPVRKPTAKRTTPATAKPAVAKPVAPKAEKPKAEAPAPEETTPVAVAEVITPEVVETPVAEVVTPETVEVETAVEPVAAPAEKDDAEKAE